MTRLTRTPWRGKTVLASAALLVAGAAVPSAAYTHTSTSSTSSPASPVSAEAGPAGHPARSGSPGPAYDRVAHFYGAYIDVANDPGSNALAAQARNFYLTKDLRARLLTWEKRHDADGVLRAQNVPSAWKVTPGDNAMGHTYSTVRLTWGTGKHVTYTYLSVRSDLETRKISDITAKY
ncbi:hypothetical protein [Streptomyces sp. NPDC059009]|uniref:hypothetical protein n=1 Tax=Streptomyces sp. NPDC059009 TaxID=3346694 RepID=UPI0036B98EF4